MSASPDRASAPGLSRLATWWLVASAIVTFMDLTFVLFRPHTLPGGKYVNTIPWSRGWHIYIENDKRYGDLKDGWVVLQSWLNLIEIIGQLAAVYLDRQGRHTCAHKLCAFLSVCTWYKTVIYLALETVDGHPFTKHLTRMQFWVNVVLPSSFWVAIPGYLAYESFGRLTGPADSAVRAASVEASPVVKKPKSKKR